MIRIVGTFDNCGDVMQGNICHIYVNIIKQSTSRHKSLAETVCLKLKDSIKSNSLLVLESEKSRKFLLKSPRTMWILCAAIICHKFTRKSSIAELLFR